MKIIIKKFEGLFSFTRRKNQSDKGNYQNDRCFERCFGIKYNILRIMNRLGMSVTVVPWNTSAEEVLEMNPEGIFLSNGPGDPAAVSEAIDSVRNLLGKLPIFGICLGHQIL